MIRVGESRGEMVVTDEDFRKLLTVVRVLSPAQAAALGAALVARSGVAAVEAPVPSKSTASAAMPAVIGPIADIEARFAADPRCPSCHSAAIGKWGSANRLARYRCLGDG